MAKISRVRISRGAPKPLFDSIFLTCEHGGNLIPPEYAEFFAGKREVLKTHRGLDIGALAVAKQLAVKLDAPLLYVEISRLLIDLNRSSHNPRLFSEFTRTLAPDLRRQIIDKHYTPHRRAVELAIKKEISHGRRVLHLGIHSFTPVLNGVKRQAEVGVLYDPIRSHEKSISERLVMSLKSHLKAASCAWRVRKNYPYYGSSDGLTTTLRQRFKSSQYFGIELEMNQAIVSSAAGRKQMTTMLSATLKELVSPS